MEQKLPRIEEGLPVFDKKSTGKGEILEIYHRKLGEVLTKNDDSVKLLRGFITGEYRLFLVIHQKKLMYMEDNYERNEYTKEW